MLTEVATLPQPSKEFKAFCNSLRCPLCNAQLDGNIHPKEAKLYCCINNDEYKCRWVPHHDEPEMECLKFWYPQYEYVIAVQLMGIPVHGGQSAYHTNISRFNRDMVPGIHRQNTREELFDYRGPRLLVFRQRMDEDAFLKKLKTYNVFS